jgi:hypothetical protein
MVCLLFGVIGTVARRWHGALVLLAFAAAAAGSVIGHAAWCAQHPGFGLRNDYGEQRSEELSLQHRRYCGWGIVLGFISVPLAAAIRSATRTRRD